jgi:hypothetical protein
MNMTITETIAEYHNREAYTSHEENVYAALQEYYEYKQPTTREVRDCKIVSLCTGCQTENLIRAFLESNRVQSVLETKDAFNSFVSELMSDVPLPGFVTRLKCLEAFAACEPNKTYAGRWVESSRPGQLVLDISESLPNQKVRPLVTYDKNTKQLSIPKQFKLL